MLSVILFLILFFILLITFQITLAFTTSSVIEGMNTPNYIQYNKNVSENAFLLAQQNAGNIEYLKGRIEDSQGGPDINKQVQDLSGNVQSLQEQVNGLVTAQQQYATQMTGGVAPDISGVVDDESQDTSNLVTE